MNNLAVSAALMGNPQEALRIATERFERRLAMFGESDEQLWETGSSMAYYMRELGDPESSLRMLKRALSHLGWSGSRSSLGLLRVLSGLAITERRLGLSFEARNRDVETLANLHRH